MGPPDYQDLPLGALSSTAQQGAFEARVIAGQLRLQGHDLAGPLPPRTTNPVLFDATLQPNSELVAEFARAQPAWVYVYRGTLTNLQQQQLGVFAPGDGLLLHAGSDGASVLVLSGAPTNEPIVQYGPFVMNSREEIEQAMQDYATGRLTA